MNRILFKLFLLICVIISFGESIYGQGSEPFRTDDLPLYQSQEKANILFDTVLIKKHLEEAVFSKNKEKELRCMVALVVRYRELGKISKSFQIVESLLEKSQIYSNIPLQMVAINNYAILCRRVDRLTDASNHHLKALKLAENYDNNTNDIVKKSICAALNGLGNISLSKALLHEALGYFFKALTLEKELNSKIGMAINEANTGAVYEYMNNMDSAVLHYELAFKLNQQAGSVKGQAICLVNLGNIWASQKNNKKALFLYDEAIRKTDSIGDVYHWLMASNSRIKILLATGRYTEIKKSSKLLIDKAINAGVISFLSELYFSLSKMSENEGNHAEALGFFKLGNFYKDSTDRISELSDIQDIKMKYESEKKESQIVLLKIKNQTNQFVRNIFIVLSIALIALVIALWTLARFRRKDIYLKEKLLCREKELHKLSQENLNTELQLKNQELHAIAEQLVLKNAILSQLKESIEEKGLSIEMFGTYNNDLTQERDWESFAFKFEKVYPDFFRNLRKNFPDITTREERLCAYLRINLTSKEIAQILNVTVAAIDKSRNRLRKKLSLHADQNLVELMVQIG